MRWYVSRNGETVGLVEYNLHVRDEHGGAWMPITQSPFGSSVRLAIKNHPSYTTNMALALLFSLFGFIVGVLLLLKSDPLDRKRHQPIEQLQKLFL